MSNPNYKAYFCVDAYACMVKKLLGRNPFTESKGNHVRRCPKGSKCYGAHFEEEMKIKPFIKKFETIDCSKIDLMKYDTAIFTVLNEARGKIQDAELKRKLINLNTMNFVERLQLWIELYYWSSKEKKNGNRNVPRFSIDNPKNDINEDYMWALERLTHMCPKHLKIKNKIKNREFLTIRDTCLGGYNCKYGAHYEEQMVNIQDLLTGVSNDPFTKEMYERKKSDIQSSIDDMERKIISMENKVNKNKKLEEKLAKFKKIVFAKKRELRTLPRQVHLTERGLIPMSVHLERIAKVEEEKSEKMKVVDNVSKKTRRRVVKKPF